MDMTEFFVIEDAGIIGDTACVYIDETKQNVCLKLFLCFIACLKVELQERHHSSDQFSSVQLLSRIRLFVTP